MAAIYAQLQEMESANHVQMDELKQEVNRLDSNAQSQKRFFGQQISVVEERSQSAFDRTNALQQQVDELHQQLSDMHKSLSAMHSHSTELNKGLGMVMEKFQQLSFDLPHSSTIG